MKYIIESNDVIGYTPKYAMLFGDGYMIQPLEDLEVLNSDYINEHFSDLQDTAYQRGLEDGKAQSELGCEGCKYESRTSGENPCFSCARNANDYWTAKQTDDKSIDIIRNGIHNWMTELNVKAEDIQKILKDMRHD